MQLCVFHNLFTHVSLFTVTLLPAIYYMFYCFLDTFLHSKTWYLGNYIFKHRLTEILSSNFFKVFCIICFMYT